MSTRRVPEQIFMRCDICGAEHDCRGHSNRPAGWARLTIQQDAEDFQGQAVADGTVVYDLCRRCRLIVVETLCTMRGKTT